MTVEDSAANAIQAAFALTVNSATNPVPVLTSLSPTAAFYGASSTTISLVGSGLEPASQVVWDLTNIPTTYVDATHVSAEIDSSLLTGVYGTHRVTIVNPTPAGGTSAAQTFTVSLGSPVPTLGSVSPSQIPVTNVATQITITPGSMDAVSSTVVAIGTQGLVTTLKPNGTLTATVPASYLASDGTLIIDLYTPAPGGGYSPTSVQLTVGAPTGLPTLTGLSQSSAIVGDTFTLTVTGTGFAAGGQIYFGPTALTTTVTSSTSAQATVDASLTAKFGDIQVTFLNPSPSGASTALGFVINAVRPANFAWLSTSGNCGLTTSHQVYCWGLSAEDNAIHPYPYLAAGGMMFDSISSDARGQICGLTGGQLYCWGQNDFGQAGGPIGVVSPTPVALFAGTTFQSVVTGGAETCGLTTSGSFYCWGTGSSATGTDIFGTSGAATNVISGTYGSICASPALGQPDAVCGLDSTGLLKCDSGGTGASPDTTHVYNSLTCAEEMTCGVVTAGIAYCWSEQVCALGTTASPHPQEVAMPGGVQVANIQTTCQTTCALSTAGNVYCSYASINPSTMVQVAGLPTMSTISISNQSACGVSTTGESWCWSGGGSSYPLGDGQTAVIGTAEQVP